MSKHILAERDLASDLDIRNFVVPSMQASIALDNRELFKGYDGPDERLILQSLAAVAIEELKASAKAFRSAIEDLDRKIDQDPPTSIKEVEDREETLSVLCGQIARAQEERIRQAVEDAWKTHRRRTHTLRRMNLKFSARIAVAAVQLSVSVAAAALSLGTLAVSILGAAYTVASTVELIRNFVVGQKTLAGEIIALDAGLSRIYLQPRLKGKVGRAAREVLGAAGVPFLTTARALSKKIDDFLGSSARLDAKVQALYQQANTLMAAIEKAPPRPSPANRRALDDMSGRTTEMLDQIASLVRAIEADNVFHRVYRQRCDRYKELDGKALGATAAAVSVTAILTSLAFSAKTVVDIGKRLA